MGISESDILSFTNFLRQKVADGGTDLTIPQIAAKWETSRETAEIITAINEGQAELAAGGGRPAADVVANIRRDLSAK